MLVHIERLNTAKAKLGTSEAAMTDPTKNRTTGRESKFVTCDGARADRVEGSVSFQAATPQPLPNANVPLRRKILAVDDEPDILSVVLIGLESENFEVITARDGRQALECVAQFHPDLIIMDVVMPKMSGLAALRSLKENPTTENIPIIMLTARDSEADILSGWLRGADLYMTKPFDIWQLIANVHTVFRDQDRADENYL